MLEVHYNLVCLDTSTGVLESAAKGILQLADQIVVVTAPSLDSARTASSTLDWLQRNGHADLVQGAVAVVNSVRPRSQVELARVVEHFDARCREVVQRTYVRLSIAGAQPRPDFCRPLSMVIDSHIVAEKLDPSDLVGAADVSQILGLSHATSVTTYLRRYPDFPKPLVEVSSSHARLWSRQDIERWHRRRGKQDAR